MKIFLDSSALAQRYIDEPCSQIVEEIFLTTPEIGISVLCPVEIISALNRRLREGRIPRQPYRKIRSKLFEDCDSMEMISLEQEIISGAISLLERHILRASDALHIASARIWICDLFVSADQRQCNAAELSGLTVRYLSPGKPIK